MFDSNHRTIADDIGGDQIKGLLDDRIFPREKINVFPR